jgi:hypothetical protein
MSDMTANMNVAGGPKIEVKKVTGNLKMADPVKSVMDQIANPPCPREQMRGQRNSKHYDENGKAFRGSEFVTPEAGD